MIGVHADIDPALSIVHVKTFNKLPASAGMGEWSASGFADDELARFGFKVAGGGPHQSKTMMLSEFTTLLAGNDGEAPGPAILDHNALGKPSARARKAALDNLRRLYAVGADAPIGVVLRRLWGIEPEARPLLALLCALSRDPLLRAGASAVLDAKLGEQVKAPAIAAVVELH